MASSLFILSPSLCRRKSLKTGTASLSRFWLARTSKKLLSIKTMQCLLNFVSLYALRVQECFIWYFFLLCSSNREVTFYGTKSTATIYIARYCRSNENEYLAVFFFFLGRKNKVESEHATSRNWALE